MRGWAELSRGTRVVLLALGALVVLSMVVTGVFTKLLGGDQRVLVVTMRPDAGQAGREVLKRACGQLPGISVVADRGDPDPRIQGRFPVRFSLSGATAAQEAALTACVNRFPALVRGLLVED